MKKPYIFFVAGGLLAATFAYPVLSEVYSPSAGAGKMQKAAAFVAPKVSTDQCLARHRMYGDVKEIDHVKGLVTFSNNIAEMKLHFPPEEINNLHIGSSITVELGYYTGVFEQY